MQPLSMKCIAVKICRHRVQLTSSQRPVKARFTGVEWVGEGRGGRGHGKKLIDGAPRVMLSAGAEKPFPPPQYFRCTLIDVTSACLRFGNAFKPL